ncbi:MAG: folylpolyglutamate synthase/dihydrofolate synthase family protein [Planctomycetota bacterium]|nr:folylpolyglutamate synthase/dihydrofolate synthase family protein [Planctomycetota bacterium]
MAARLHNDNSCISDSNATRQAAVDFLFGRIDYERALAVPYRTREFKLDRMRRLLALLDNPQRGLGIVHVAGTKGKGSTASFLSRVLMSAGFSVGLFTSPHLDRIEERLAVDGLPCTADELVALVERLRPAVAIMDREAALAIEKTGDGVDGDADGNDCEGGPTYFELATAMGLMHFADRKVDLAVLEVGLGGRLDSTNVCDPIVAVITSISLDHTRQLGDTLGKIAREKAGIIKPGVPVVSGVVATEPRDVIREVCRNEDAPLVELGQDFDYQYHAGREPDGSRMDFEGRSCRYESLRLGLLGRHQACNAAVSLAVVEQLRLGGWKISAAAVREGLAAARCAGRVEVLRRRPLVVVDTAHNRASIEALVETLDESFEARRRILIFATTQEKDIEGMFAAMRGRFDRMLFTQYQHNPRGVPPLELNERWTATGEPPADIRENPEKAWQTALAWASTHDMICVAGSFYIVSELRPVILGEDGG